MSKRDFTHLVGTQPCEDFDPQSGSHPEVMNEHECPKCKLTVSFCLNCHKDHHYKGWDCCDFIIEQKTEPKFKDVIDSIQIKLKKLEEITKDDAKHKLIVLAHHIRAYRAMNNLTVKELAKKLHVTKMSIIRWEKGEIYPNNSNLARFKEIGIIT